ncbi:hypothetical protein Tco_0716116 [Tanacetum coccineum]
MAIRGISVNGEWVMDPPKVKQEFFQHFANRFSSSLNHYNAVFIGEWRKENLRHLVNILHYFYLASGLRINIHKCCIMGVGGVTNVEVNRGAQMIGCEASKTPFKYLEVMVGGKMNRLHSWDVVIDKVMARLSKWKAKTLSIGGRFTLTKSVLTIFFRCVEPGTRKVSWFSWDNVVVSKEVGGLGMSSFFAMNCALLFKWIWRFKVQPKAMWVSVIKAIHGRLGNWDRGVTVGKSSTWPNCIRCISNLKERGVDLYMCMKKKVGNGSDSLFWLENWLGKGLEDRQVGAEGVQIEEVSNLIDSLEFIEDHDKWVWNLEGDGVFKVSSARRFIDEGLCDMDGIRVLNSAAIAAP